MGDDESAESNPVTKEKQKSKFVVRSATDMQRIKLEKLMEHPEKPVIIPHVPREKKLLSAIPTFVRNVMGSSAGAGSGEFHVYRHLRRKEYARQKHIQHQSRQEELDAEYQSRLETNRLDSEAKTAKKRAKRQKKKINKKANRGKDRITSNKQAENEDEEEDDSESEKEMSDSEEKQVETKETEPLQVENSVKVATIAEQPLREGPQKTNDKENTDSKITIDQSELPNDEKIELTGPCTSTVNKDQD